eukprot:2487110-Amphidinium_carterae.1
MDIRQGSPLGKRQGDEGADSLEPDLQKPRTETEPAGSTTGAVSSSSAPPRPADMDVGTGGDAGFREKRRQHELQEADVLFPDANAKRTKTTEDMVISVLVGDYNGQVLDLRGLQQSEADMVEREGIKHLILHWDGVAWQKEIARECARIKDLGSIKGVTTVTEESGQLDVVHARQHGDDPWLGHLLSLDGNVSNEHNQVLYEEMERQLQGMSMPAKQREKPKNNGVRSLVYGAYTKQGSGVTHRTFNDITLLKTIHKLIKTNKQVGRDRGAYGHRDRVNLPGTLIWTTSFGPFAGSGGRLWRFDPLCNTPPPAEIQDQIPEGAKGTMTSTFQKWVELRGEGWHAVEAPRKGVRWSLSVYSAGSLHLLSTEHWSMLLEHGFPVRRLRSMYLTPRVSALRAEQAVLMANVDDKNKLSAGDHVDEEDPWLGWPELYTQVYDNITGQILLAELVSEARREEMKFLSDLDAYEVVPIERSHTMMGGPPIPVGWVDVNKGDAANPKVRS